MYGLTITADLTGAFHVRISDIGTGVDALFRALPEARPPHLEGLVALIDTASARLLTAAYLGTRHVTGPTFVIPCAPVLECHPIKLDHKHRTLRRRGSFGIRRG